MPTASSSFGNELIGVELEKFLPMIDNNIDYILLYNNSFYQAFFKVNTTKPSSGSSSESTFQGTISSSYILDIVSLEGKINFSVTFSQYYGLIVNTTTKNFNITNFGSPSPNEPLGQYVFYPSQTKQLLTKFARNFGDLFNQSHFKGTPIKNCPTANRLDLLLKNMSYSQNYTYFCGRDKEINAQFVRSILIRNEFHTSESNFNSTFNITLQATLFVGDKPIQKGSIEITANVLVKNNQAKFTNGLITLGGFNCATENPKLVDMIIVDFNGEFKDHHFNLTTIVPVNVNSLKFLS